MPSGSKTGAGSAHAAKGPLTNIARGPEAHALGIAIVAAGREVQAGAGKHTAFLQRACMGADNRSATMHGAVTEHAMHSAAHDAVHATRAAYSKPNQPTLSCRQRPQGKGLSVLRCLTQPALA